ncbi:MAG: FkbM family methyltransferase [Nanoarchaeota archaeon]
MSNLVESLKYLTVLFQMRTNYFSYIKAIFLYRLKRKIEFPKAIVKLNGAEFITRKNSMDIAHLSNLYERETTKLLLNLNPKIFVDIGAHIGRFSVILANKKSKVIAIEPSTANFEQLNKNIKLNNLQDKIKVLNVGCSDKNGNKALYFVPHNEGLTSLEKKEGTKKEIIKVKKLDNICNNLHLNPNQIDIIKIDVEGFELNVLKGALNILKKGAPLLIVEITDKRKEKPIKEFLNKLGFINKKILDLRNFIFVKK